MSGLVLPHHRLRPERIHPVHEGFRDLEPPEAFTWELGIEETALSGAYAVVFLSLRNLKAPLPMVQCLLELDNNASEEAQTMPGFRTYWHDDVLSPEGQGQSFCLWDSEKDAKYAASQPAHVRAVSYAHGEGREVYLSYRIKKYNIFRFAGSKVVFELVA